MNAEILLKHFDRISETPGAVPRLRRFILDLAVRGKLGEQDPHDEPALTLIGKILKKGKCLLLKNEPFPLSESWLWVKLGDISEIERGGSPRPIKDYLTDNPDGLNWIKIGDTDMGGKYISTTKEKIRKEGLIKTRMVYPGDFLLTNSMSFGRPYITQIEGCIHDGWLRIHPPEILDKDYLYNLLSSPYVGSFFKGAASGAVVSNLNSEKVRELPIPLPPLAEQLRIVAKVDELMALCDQLEAERNKREARRDRLVASSLNRICTTTAKDAIRFHLNHLPRLTTRTEHIKQLRQSVLSLAVRGLLVPQDPNDEPVTVVIDRIKKEKVHLVALGKIKLEKPLDLINLQNVPFDAPAGWAWRKIDSIVRSLRNDIRTGPFGSTLHKDEHRPTGVPVWGIESINKNGSFNGKCKIYVDAKKARELLSFAVKGGDIIISRSGTVGELCRLPDDAPYGLLSTNLMKISLDKEVVSPDYFCLLFKGAESIDTQLIELCAGSTRLFLTQSILAKLHFPLPPLAEQHRIVAKVDGLMALCDQLEARLTTTEADSRRLLEAVLRDALNPVIQEAA